jgi:hypothetical protein
MLARVDEDSFGDPWVSNYFVTALFGFDNKHLSCENNQAKWVPRSKDFCDTGANYNLEGLKALAKIDGAGDYVGTESRERLFTMAPTEDPTSCGQRQCSSRGVCTINGGCACNAGFWGINCEFGELKPLVLCVEEKS